jgi:hypothetical protein
MVGTFSLRMCGYFCPTPTNTIGFPVECTMLIAVPTLSSTVSNLVRIMPSIVLGLLSLTAKSIRELLNLVN